ncbi:MAG: hypothetical protein HS119_11620 [Flavobacteriales bacterium]|nr:hypothetical protein [Flavobacteriales bacterium]MBE7443092.1 hypothetical protein [Flavobacteriales bacterium]
MPVLKSTPCKVVKPVAVVAPLNAAVMVISVQLSLAVASHAVVFCV